jgi:C4-dicarboxylate transporter DctQ subunit
MKILDHLEEWLITFLMGGGDDDHLCLGRPSLPGGSVDSRACRTGCLSLNFGWAQELCIIMFVWMAKFGAAYGVRTGIHVGVDVLINRMTTARAQVRRFRPAGRRAVYRHRRYAGRHFVWENGFHYAFLYRWGWDVGDVPEGPTTPDLEWPTWIVYSAIPLGSSLMCFRFLQVTVELPQDRRTAAPRSRPCRRNRGGNDPVDVNVL